MEIVYKKVNDLIPYINNSRTHSEEQVNQIVASINEFGFTNPLLIDEKDSIIAGHGRLLASKKLGMEEVPCIVLKGLTEAQKKAYMIADNKMALNAGWDEELLKLELENLKELDFDLELTGFNVDELDDILGKNEEDFFEITNDEENLFEDIEKLESHYGVPYQGNKSRIADIIINILPKGKRLVDLFGGGGAITHCALLSNKWENYLYNDINSLITGLFIDAINGKYHDENRVITREDFEQLKDTDAYVKYIWSFGNNGTGYLWGKDIEEIKCQACRCLLEQDVKERRLAYIKFIKMLKENNCNTLDRLQSIEHLQALTQLESLQRLEVSNISYEDYEYQDGDIIYCDVPYEKINKNKCDDYGVEFDSLKFYDWVKKQPCQVFFSSYEISDDSFYKVKLKSVMSLIGANTNGQFVNEYLYSNKEIKIKGE